MYTRSVRSPTSFAAFGLSAVACMKRPARVSLKNRAKTIITAQAAPSTTSCCDITMIPAKLKGSGEMRGGKVR